MAVARNIPFLVGNPYKPSFVTVTGWGVHRIDICEPRNVQKSVSTKANFLAKVDQVRRAGHVESYISQGKWWENPWDGSPLVVNSIYTLYSGTYGVPIPF